MLPRLLDPRPDLADLRDPRRETRNKLHALHDLLMIVLCAVLSGVEDWVGMEAFAEEKAAWLREFLDLANGIPSHETLSDVMGRIDPVALRTAFSAWATAAIPALANEQVCIDGKTLRGSRDGADGAVLCDQIAWLTAKPDWAGLQAVGRIESTRIVGEHTTTEYRYFLCSFTDPERFAQTVRGHWGIENQQHWILDVQIW